MSVIGRRPIDASHESAAARQQQHDRDADQHRLLHFVLLAKHVRQRARDQQHERPIAERVGCAHAPARRRRASPRCARSAPALAGRPRSRSSRPLQRAPSTVPRASRIASARPGAVTVVGRLRPPPSPRSSCSFSSSCITLVERGGERLELAIDAADADPPLLPQHVGAEQAQHDEQRERVPQRQPRPQRQRRSWRRRLRSPADSPSPRRVRISDSVPDRSSLRRSRCT